MATVSRQICGLISMGILAASVARVRGEAGMPDASAGGRTKTPAPWDTAAVQERIQKHRTAEVTLTVTGAAGKPLANVPVTVRMTRHKFLFGCNGFNLDPAKDDPAQAAYRALFTNLLNYATLPFYWGGFEREQGRLDTERLMDMARWFTEHNVHVKGHPLVWNMVPPRLLPSDVTQVRALQETRVRRDVTAFRGAVDRWDAINEVVAWDRPRIQNPLTDLGKALGDLELVKLAFTAARESHPGAFLLINDFRVDKAYADLIRRCLDAGVTIDAIGLQSHMHQGVWSEEALWGNLERFAGFGKPLHLTEVTVISGNVKMDMDWHDRYENWPSTPEGEAKQAKEAERFYTLAFSHPALEAITWWDFTDGCWLGAPAGLVRKDLTPKPAYEALRRLIRKDWWTPEQTLTTDARGRIVFRAFLGEHEAIAAGGSARFPVAGAGATAAEARMEP
jgi:GH35 family endo-1,4-beta-xylanase